MILFIYILAASLQSITFAENTIKSTSFVRVRPITESKLKRDATLNVGSYYGPAHKYLPPSLISPNYGSSNSHLNGGFAASSKGHSYSLTAPKLETYIVQTENQGLHDSHYKNEYKYSKPSIYASLGHKPPNLFFPSHTSNSGRLDINGQSGHGYSYSKGLNNGGALGIPANNGGYYQSTSKFPSTLESLSLSTNNIKIGNHLMSHGHNIYSQNQGKANIPIYAINYTPTMNQNSHYSHSSSTSSLPHFISSGHDLQKVQHVSQLPADQTFNHGVSQGYSHQPVYQSASVTNQDYNFGNEQDVADNSVHVSPGNVDGYHYENPSNSFETIKPVNSYGIPLNSVTSHELNKQDQTDDTPSYAAGHKGLSHFAYTSSKPQALNTDVTGSYKHSFTNAPFKPSTFLGAHIETSDSFKSLSSEFNSPASLPSEQYIPPPSEGFEYQGGSQTSSAYSTSSSDESSAPIYEPDSTYLPPSGSQGTSYDSSSPLNNHQNSGSIYGSHLSQ